MHAALREGFGLPLLEAVRLGTPVVVTSSAVPRALAGHVQTFPPRDAAAMARAIESALRGEQRASADAAREATAMLTWDRCTAMTAEVYRRFL